MLGNWWVDDVSRCYREFLEGFGLERPVERTMAAFQGQTENLRIPTNEYKELSSSGKVDMTLMSPTNPRFEDASIPGLADFAQWRRDPVQTQCKQSSEWTAIRPNGKQIIL